MKVGVKLPEYVALKPEECYLPPRFLCPAQQICSFLLSDSSSQLRMLLGIPQKSSWYCSIQLQIGVRSYMLRLWCFSHRFSFLHQLFATFFGIAQVSTSYSQCRPNALAPIIYRLSTLHYPLWLPVHFQIGTLSHFLQVTKIVRRQTNIFTLNRFIMHTLWQSGILGQWFR